MPKIETLEQLDAFIREHDLRIEVSCQKKIWTVRFFDQSPGMSTPGVAYISEKVSGSSTTFNGAMQAAIDAFDHRFPTRLTDEQMANLVATLGVEIHIENKKLVARHTIGQAKITWAWDGGIAAWVEVTRTIAPPPPLPPSRPSENRGTCPVCGQPAHDFDCR